MSLLPHLQCRPDQIAERVVLCGDPARVDRIAGQLDECDVLGQHREFRLINYATGAARHCVQHRHRRRLRRHRAGGAGAGGRPLAHPGRLRRRPAA